MAAVVTASSGAANVFIAVCDRVVGLGDKYYLQEKAWKSHKRSLEGYKNEVTLWKDAASRRGLSSHPDVIKYLQVAVDSLTEAETELKKKESTRTAIFRRKVSRTLFPNLVENSLQQVDDAFGDIRKVFQKKEGADEVFEVVVDSSDYSDCFSHDSLYVHFEETETKIFEALNEDIGVVLLHGGVGKGKSTVVGNIAAYYDPELWLDANRKSECVVLHDCGSTPPISFTELLRQLILRLGGKPAEDKDTSRSICNEKRFKSLLEERKMLLILDNLGDEGRDEDFLLSIVRMRVRGLKLLIAAQLETVCKVLDPKLVAKIRIQDVDKDTARKILAVHAGFPNQEIPSNVLKYADKLIPHADGLPLALATLGGAIDRRRKYTEREWEDLCRDLSAALKQDKVPQALFHIKHPGLWSTLNLVIMTRLSAGARKLLVLSHALASTACLQKIPFKLLALWGGSRGPEPLRFFFPHVAESVIELFYDILLGVEGPFSVARQELCDRQLIRIWRDPTFPSQTIQLGLYDLREEGIMWSVHSLQRLFIENVDSMRDDKNSIVESLIRTGNSYIFGEHLLVVTRILQSPLQVKERPAKLQLLFPNFVSSLLWGYLAAMWGGQLVVGIGMLGLFKYLSSWIGVPLGLDIVYSKRTCRHVVFFSAIFSSAFLVCHLVAVRKYELIKRRRLAVMLWGVLLIMGSMCMAGLLNYLLSWTGVSLFPDLVSSNQGCSEETADIRCTITILSLAMLNNCLFLMTERWVLVEERRREVKREMLLLSSIV
ncbi:unnamed protein product [Calypogeia fissa]